MTLQSSFCLAIAQVYNNEGTEAFLKEDYSNAVYFYTEGIKVNCKDEDCMAVLYGNRASANFKEGQLMCFCFFVFCVFFHKYWAAWMVSELSAHLICNPAELLGLPFALPSSVAMNSTPRL